jgi:hypothetical protein
MIGVSDVKGGSGLDRRAFHVATRWFGRSARNWVLCNGYSIRDTFF